MARYRFLTTGIQHALATGVMNPGDAFIVRFKNSNRDHKADIWMGVLFLMASVPHLVSICAPSVQNHYLASGKRIRGSEHTRHISQAGTHRKSHILLILPDMHCLLTRLSKRLSKSPLRSTLNKTTIPVQSFLTSLSGKIDNMIMVEGF